MKALYFVLPASRSLEILCDFDSAIRRVIYDLRGILEELYMDGMSLVGLREYAITSATKVGTLRVPSRNKMDANYYEHMKTLIFFTVL
jgi:hypothetical protein